MKDDPEELLIFRVAQEFGLSPLEVEGTFTTDLLYRAAAYMVWKADMEKKAIDEAKRSAR